MYSQTWHLLRLSYLCNRDLASSHRELGTAIQ